MSGLGAPAGQIDRERARARARDLVVYELEVETDTGEVRLEFDEAGAPEDPAALVDDLASRANPMAP